MENKEHEKHGGDQHAGDDANRSVVPHSVFQNVQVPSSLLPAVLHRLNLSSNHVPEENPINALLISLKSEHWEERANAVRALGKLDKNVPLELLEAALDDKDGTVRAAAVHVLGNTGKQASLRLLVTALHDTDWHVRETAVFALQKQGKRLPREVIMTALHDSDASVREAAHVALQWNTSQDRTTAFYKNGLQEQQSMKSDEQDIALSNGREGYRPLQTMSSESQNGDHTYSGFSHQVREQIQEYASPEYTTERPAHDEEYRSTLSSRGEKIGVSPSYPTSQKGWWAVVVVTAICFFLLGVLTTSFLSGGFGRPAVPPGMSIVSAPPDMTIQDQKDEPFKVLSDPISLRKLAGDPKYRAFVQNEMALNLNLTPQQFQEQLKNGVSLEDIADKQSISTNRLQAYEWQTLVQVLDMAVQAGDATKAQANQVLLDTQRNPEQLEQSIMMFLIDNTDNKS